MNKENIGVAASRNVAISLAKGDYLHIIDQDDLVDEQFYMEVINLLDRYNFILINGIATYNSKKYNSHKLQYFKPDLSIKGLIKDDFIRSPGQVVFSKKLIEDLMFPEPKKFKGADDRFFWMRIFLKNEMEIRAFYLKTPLYVARIHENNFSADTLNLRRSGLENYSIMQSELDTSKYKNLIDADIKSLKYSAGEHMDFLSTVLGAYSRFRYFFKLNKLVRFYYKRTPFSSKTIL